MAVVMLHLRARLAVLHGRVLRWLRVADARNVKQVVSRILFVMTRLEVVNARVVWTAWFGWQRRSGRASGAGVERIEWHAKGTVGEGESGELLAGAANDGG